MCGQPDVGCEHKPKRVITHEWNIDKHRDQREKGDNERNYMNAEKIENPNRNSHIASLLKSFAGKRVRVFLKKHKQNGSLTLFLTVTKWENQHSDDV